MFTRGQDLGGRGIDWEFGIDIKLPYLKFMTKKDLL